MSPHHCERIGHGGASALAPANTLASFEAAREIGVDMVEFDVRAWEGELVLAHTVLHARRGGNLRLGEALRHLSDSRFSGIGLTSTSSTRAASRRSWRDCATRGCSSAR